MTVTLLDYESRPVVVEVGELESIGRMDIDILSGDEILTVIYKDYTIKKFDSCPGGRIHGYEDGGYELYNAITGVNYFNRDAFMNRTSSYWFYHDEEDEEP